MTYSQVDDLIINLISKGTAFNDFILQMNTLLESNWQEHSQYRILLPVFDDNYEALLCTGFIRELKRCYPHSWLIVVTNKSNSYFDDHPSIDELIKVDLINETNFLTLMRNVVQILKRHKTIRNVDLAFSLTDYVANIFFNWLSGAKERIGYEMNNEIDQLLTKRVNPFNAPINGTLTKFYFLEWLGFTVENKSLDLKFKERPPLNKKIICVDVSGFIPSWKFSIKKMAKVLLDKFTNNECLMIHGDEIETKYLTSLLTENIYTKEERKLTNFIDFDVNLLPQVSLYLGNNTEVMHICAMLNKPMICLFSSVPTTKVFESEELTLLNKCKPVTKGKLKILSPEYALEECANLNNHSECCLKSYPHCINEITIEQIEDAIDEIYT